MVTATRDSEIASLPDVPKPVGVTCSGLSRDFGGTRALDGVDFDIAAGTIHALVGQNGAGKSTFLGMIAGRIRPSSGNFTVLGKTIHYGKPRASQEAGVAAVYQELTVIPQLTPQANVFLSNPITRGGLLRRGEIRKRYEQICADLGIPPAPDVPVGRLTVAQRQLIEICRAIAARSSVLLLDEPTTALALEERDALFRLLRSLRDGGTTIILISHNLDEVLANADMVTVFRDGRLIATRSARECTKRDLIALMLGDSPKELLEAGIVRWNVQTTKSKTRDTDLAYEVAPQRSVRLRARNIELAGGRLSDVSIDVHEGEVVGVAGLMGSGRSSLLRVLGGAERGARGTLEVNGRSVPLPSSPRAAQALGIVMLPEDRKTEGVCLAMTSADNVALPRFRTVSRWTYLSPRRTAKAIGPHLRTVGGDLTKIARPARSLSGGNQQKLLFARVSFVQPRILLADEPTRGIDVGAKEDILNEIRRVARQEGVAVVLVSSELEEVIAFSDRILVMSDGCIVSEFNAEDVSVNDLLQAAFGASESRT